MSPILNYLDKHSSKALLMLIIAMMASVILTGSGVLWDTAKADYEGIRGEIEESETRITSIETRCSDMASDIKVLQKDSSWIVKSLDRIEAALGTN